MMNCATVIVGCVKVLVDWGMDPNLHRKGQVTPLMDACTTEHLKLVQFFDIVFLLSSLNSVLCM